jgi:outer membrane protein assembly factor BamD
MKSRVPFIILLAAFAGGFCQVSSASVIFRPKEKAKYIAPGDEEITGDAQQLFEIAQKAEKENDNGRAIKAYRTLVKKYRKDALAPWAAFRASALWEKEGDYLKAANAYRALVELYPASPYFEPAIEAQFRIGEMYLSGKKLTVFGVGVTNALDQSIAIFAAIVRVAPYGKYTARAQFNIGFAREKQGAEDAALQAYQAVVDKFPNEPIAAAAQYQIGYIWLTAAKQGTKDLSATSRARNAFQDFLFRYPNNEKTAQARANLETLEHKQTSSSFSVAKFYDKQKNFRAAVIYYNEVIRQQPGSNESEQAKKRIEELRKKLGDAALQPAFAKADGEKKKGDKSNGEGRTAAGGPAMRGSANDVAPLPPPETDLSLPPPASLSPDTTTAPAPPPDTSLTSETSSTTPSPAPESSSTTDASPTAASPAPEANPTTEASPAAESSPAAEATASPSP